MTTAASPAKSTKARDIQEALAADIVHGRLAPGAALDEQALAAAFGVSRTPIREALRHLHAAGLVASYPHRGAMVRDISPDRLDDMFSVMAELEALCARWSALAMSTAERRRLRDILDRSANFVKTGRRADYVVANDRFHDAIYDGAHSPFLAETTRQVRTRLTPFRRAQFEGDERLAKSHAEHGRVVAAIEKGDAEAAADEMRLHLGVVRKAVNTVMRSAPPRDAALSKV